MVGTFSNLFLGGFLSRYVWVLCLHLDPLLFCAFGALQYVPHLKHATCMSCAIFLFSRSKLTLGIDV